MHFKCYVTLENIDPAVLWDICKNYGFQLAARKSKESLICVSQSYDGEELRLRMRKLLQDLTGNSLKILRYKIESIVLDSKYKDVEGFINESSDS